MADLAKMFIVIRVLFIAVGAVLLITGKIPGIGKLPGDIMIKKDNFSLYFPITTCILISIIFTLISFIWPKK